MPTSFIRSTIDFFQSSFSLLFAERPSRTDATSTAGGGAAAMPGGFPTGGGGAAMPGGFPTGGGGAAMPGGLPAGASDFWVAAGPPPKILDIRVLNNFMGAKKWQLSRVAATQIVRLMLPA